MLVLAKIGSFVNHTSGLRLLGMVNWFVNQRLLQPLGNIPPVEFEQRHYRRQQIPTMVAGLA
jgi:hypothetical protein